MSSIDSLITSFKQALYSDNILDTEGLYSEIQGCIQKDPKLAGHLEFLE